MVIASIAFRNPGTQAVNWTFPYFSGAANFARLFDWRISPSDYAKVVKMDRASYMSYRHQVSPDAIWMSTCRIRPS